MDFYLEVLDRDIKKPHENPSVGMILCKNADTDVVEYSLSRSLSQTMIGEIVQSSDICFNTSLTEIRDIFSETKCYLWLKDVLTDLNIPSESD